MNFHVLKKAVESNLDSMMAQNLFVTNVSSDDVWATYLNSFPEGSNPVFRKNTEHDCSCCRNFVKNVGNLVSLKDGKVTTVWDIKVDEPAYQAVADALSALVKNSDIKNVFLTKESSYGNKRSFEYSDDKSAKAWDHFFVDIRAKNSTANRYYCDGPRIGPVQSDKKASHDVFLRGLNEFSLDTLDTVLELINQNSLYRGAEYKGVVDAFRKEKVLFEKITDNRARDAFVWERLENSSAVLRVRNTAIGTLLIDLSEGMELDAAVRRYEATVAPQNYKRPTALVTKAMVEKAKGTLTELGYMSALDRRFARIDDVSVNDILFVDRQSRSAMKNGGDVFDDIATKASKPKNLDKVETITIEKFISDVLPNVTSMEVFFENKNINNLVSLIAPEDPNSKNMFKWDNKFSWSYKGDVTDSIKERVKRAGGNVTGDLCCRLGWYNTDDLDLHLFGPKNLHVFYGTRRAGNFTLDVDMNISGETTTPVENIFVSKKSMIADGDYHFSVNQFRRRNTVNGGFEIELSFMGEIYNFSYDKVVNGVVSVAKFRMKNGEFKMLESLPSSKTVRKEWGIETQNWHKVNVMMLSPNFWGDQKVGNKHYMFMLDKCLNDEPTRGFYNEFLNDDMTQHRKVLEVVGNKMKTDTSVNQLSGLGFSSTKNDELLVRVSGNFTRLLKITF